MDNFKNGFIKYLISSANYKGKSVASYFKDLFIGKGLPATNLQETLQNKSLAEAIKGVQLSGNRFSKNPIFKELVAVLTNGDVTERSIFDNMKLFSRKMTKYESDVLTSGLRELAEKADNTASKQIFEKLFLFSVIQSGIGNSPFSFYDKLPFDAVAPLVNAAISAYESNPNVNLSEFFVQFYLNNLNNSTLVPKIKGKVIQSLGDNAYGHMSNESVPELSMSLPKVIRVPLEGQNSYLSRNMVLKTWIMSPDVETKKKQGKRIGLWIPYVIVKSQDGFNYYAGVSPIGNAPYFTQYGKFENITPLSLLPLPNPSQTVTAWVSSKEVAKPVTEPTTIQTREYTPENITSLKPNEVFVFGANTAGGHGGGTAGLAQRGTASSNYTALPIGTKGKWSEYGVVDKLMQGTEGKSFGIVTKAATISGTSLKIGAKRSVPLSRIEESINALIKTANENPNLKFLVTKFGTNMAGFSEQEMKSLLENKTLPNNVILPKEFEVRTTQPSTSVKPKGLPAIDRTDKKCD
jgi:hypothetical protein